MDNVEMNNVLSMCGLCGEKCLVDLSVKDGRIVSVQKARDREGLKGFLCVKGAALRQYVYHKDRLQHPMKRVGDAFEEISWDQAIKEIAVKLASSREKYGAKGTVVYAGHPKWARKAISEFAATFGTPNYCTESSTCNTAMVMAWKLTSGEWMKPDLKHCDNLLIWAGNPAYSGQNYKQMTDTVQKNGAKMIVVDPRVTPMADKAYKHLQLIPGTDGALALAIANVILSEGLENREYIQKYTVGFEEYREYVKNFTPEKAAEITGVSEEDIIETARILSSGRTALHTSSCAVVDCVNGVQNLRAVISLLALTGNIDTEGGNRISDLKEAALDDSHKKLPAKTDPENAYSFERFPIWNECIQYETQCIDLADALFKEKTYPIKSFIGFGVNVNMWPRPDRIIEALKSTELTVVTELFWNEACEAADYVLPACTFQEADWVYAAPSGRIVYLPKTVDPQDKKTDVEIILALSKALGIKGDITGCDNWNAYLERILETTGVTLDELKKAPEGVQAGKLTGGKKFSLETGLNTPSGKIEFVSSVIEKHKGMPGCDPLPVYKDFRESAGDVKKYPFILCAGARKAHLFHSRTYRLKWISDLEKHTVMNICPEDAAALGLEEGGKARLSTPEGSMALYVQLDAGVKKGVVHVFHDDPGMNINLLFPEDYIDPLSGFPGFHSYICSVEKEEGQ